MLELIYAETLSIKIEENSYINVCKKSFRKVLKFQEVLVA